MERLNEERALAFLVRASSHANLKLRDVVQELVRVALRPQGELSEAE